MKSKLKLACLLTLISAAGLNAQNVIPDANDKYITAVRTCLDNLIECGTDTYGPVKAPIFVSIIDVNTHSCPQNPLPLDEQWRVIRRERRNPAGANLFTDQPLIKSMFLMSELTASRKYSAAADNYIDYYLKNLIDKKGFFWWGYHRHYDVYTDKMTGHLENWHEIHSGIQIQWERLWAINPEAVKNEIQALWQWQVINKETGETNRHDDGLKGCDFALSSGSMIEAFAFLYNKTKDKVWSDRAKLLADYYWNLRNKDTNLIAERPNAGASRFDGSSFATDITGPYCHSLLKTYLITKEDMFKEQAIAYLAAYNKFGFDKQSGKFWGALKLDGSSIKGPRIINSEYEQYEPRGYLDLWEPYILGSEFPIQTAQCYTLAYRITKNSEMLLAAERFADCIEKTPTEANETEISWYAEYKKAFGKQGTYADKYGGTISFFIDMYALTNKPKYLGLAQKFADEAIAKLYVNGLFKGHPAKPYYESIDGVGCLLYSLEELDLILKGKTQNLDFDNW
jgi:hypothetical protein